MEVIDIKTQEKNNMFFRPKDESPNAARKETTYEERRL
jgi:hypothetical protein